MIRKILIAFILSLILLIVGLVIKYFILDPKTSLQDIMFWVGAIPIFSGVFGEFFGRENFSSQFSRDERFVYHYGVKAFIKSALTSFPSSSVSNQSSNQRGVQDISDLKSGLNWILAGLLIWFYSYFM
ncbi:MAG: AsmA family protein [Desulfobacula sp.]|uniref:hypothetical protein n=1 Tax=Desulfobacula sp. TaxID=2593537 RepID=UPI0025C73789|nr:hypothetical protein [Desulfobacula sp.]MCD4720177.1 AsmA family protein [Desulfobacula sp.]